MTDRLLRRCALAFALLMGNGAVGAADGAPALRMSESLGVHASTAAAPAPSQEQPVQLRAENDVSQSIIHKLVLLKGSEMLGTDYVLGADGEDAVDCSALVQLMFRTAGIQLPRTTRELVSVGRSVDHDRLEPGDLLFYRWKRRTLHVAIYVDEGQILHASPSQREVVVTSLNPAWDRRLVGARRVL